jgi:hypothetical protein
MASWKDNLTDAEVDALYKYKTEGKQALSDAEVELVYPYAQYLKQEKAQTQPTTSATGAFTKSAVENAAPAIGGLAGGAAAMAAGAPLIAMSGPFAPATALGLGLAGGIGAGYATSKLQDVATSIIPKDVKASLGFSPEQRAAEQQQHPVASFAGELAPNLTMFRPGAVAPIVDKAGKVILGSTAQRGAMAGIGGALEAGQELYAGQPLDPMRIAGNAAFQAVAATPTRFGNKIMGAFDRSPKGVAVKENDALDTAQQERKQTLEQQRVDQQQQLRAGDTEYVALQREKQTLLAEKQTPEVKAQLATIETRLAELNADKVDQIRKGNQLGFEYEAGNLKDALSGFDKQVARSERQGPTESTDTFFVTPQGEALFNPIFEDQQRVNLARNAAGEQQQLASESGLAQRSQQGTQGDIFEPQTNMHRAYTDLQVEGANGQPRNLTRAEFEQTLAKLAKEEGTAFQHPEPHEMDAAYQKYLDAVNEKQGGLFDIASRKEAFNEGVRVDKLPGQVQEHPLVKAATERVTKQEELVLKLQMDAHDGKPVTGLLKRAEKELNNLRAVQEQQAKNVHEALLNREPTSDTAANDLRAAANGLLDALTMQAGSPGFNERPDVLKALGDFATALFNAGYTSLKRFMEAARQFLGAKFDNLSAQLNEAFAVESTKLEGSSIPANETAENIVNKAYSEKDGKQWNMVQSGATLTAMKSGSTIIREVGRIVQNAIKNAELAVHNFVFPAEKALASLSTKEFEQLADVFKREALNGEKYDGDLLAQHLSVKQIEAYTRMREMFDDTLRAQNVARRAMGKPEITPLDAYMASRWEGAFRQPVHNAEGKLVWYLAADSKMGIKKQAEALLKEQPGLVIDYAKGSQVSLRGSKTDIQSAYTTMLDILGHDDPAVQAMKKAVEEAAAMETEFARAQTKHFKTKTGVRGFVGDRPGMGGTKEALAFFEQQMEYAKNAYNWTELQKAGDIVKKVLSDERLQTEQPNNVAYAREYFKGALGQGQSAVTRAMEDSLRKGLGVSSAPFARAVADVKSYFMLDKLAASVPNVLSNTIQLINVLPHLADMRAQGYKGNIVTAPIIGTAAGMAMTSAHYMKSVGAEYMSKLPSQFFKDMFLYAEENGITARSIFDENPLGTAFNTTNKIAKGLSVTLSATDVLTRSIAFATYAQMLKDSGKFTDMRKLFQVAEERANASMVDYRQTERPLAFGKAGTIGSIASTLQTYPMNYYNQQAYFLKEMAKGNYLPLLTSLMVQYAAAGAQGLPYLDDIYKAYMYVKDHALSAEQWLKVEDGEFARDPKMWLMDTFGKSAVYGALSESTGLGLTSRLAAPGASEMIQAPGGPALDVAKQAYSAGKAIVNPTKENTAQAIMNILPSGVQGAFEMSPWMEGITYQTTPRGKGVYAASNIGEKDIHYTRTPEEESLRRLTSMKSAKEQAERDIVYSAKAKQQLTKEKSSELVDKAVIAFIDKNSKDELKYRQLYAKLTGKDIASDSVYQLALSKLRDDRQNLLEKSKSPRDMIEAIRMQKRLEAQ